MERAVPWREALATAREADSTVYDAVYVALAASRDLPLITLDEAVRRAAGRRALP